MESRGAALCAALLDRSDEGVDLQHRENKNRIAEMTQDERERGSSQQQVDQRTGELSQIYGQPAGPVGRRKPVGTEPVEALAAPRPRLIR